MDLNFNITKNSFTSQHILKYFAIFWHKVHMGLFFVLLLAAIAFGSFIWQQSLNDSGWSEQRKQEYLNAKNKSIIFKEDDFKKVLEDIQMREEYKIGDTHQNKDIFASYR